MRIDSPKMTNSNATGSFTGSFAGDGSLLTGLTTASYINFDNVDLGATTLLSSSAQISSDISGSFTAVSSSFSTRVTDLEAFSSSLDATYATDAQVATAVSALNAATSSYALAANISGSFTALSSSLSIRLTDDEGSIDALNAATSSYALVANISGSFTALSSSLSTRLTDDEVSIDSLNAATSSYALAANISGSFTSVSSSLASRISTAELELSNTLVSASIQIDHDQTTNFVANEHINHAAVSMSAGDGLTGGGNITTSRTFAVDGTVLRTTGYNVISSSAQIDHDLTTNFVNDEHVAHSSVTLTAGDGLSGGGDITTSRTFAVDGTVLRTTGDNVISSSAQVDHDQTTNFVADEHVAHSSVSITAGDGLSGGGTIAATRTLSVDGTVLRTTGDSVISGSIQVDHDQTTNFVANEHIDHSTVSITAGSGLTGGGTIAANRTINVGQGDGISVSADAVAVDSTVIRTSGGQSIGGTTTFTNINVNGTGSFAYIQSVTGSAKIIGDAFIIVNNNTPSERYAGLAVYDSGSAGTTGSLFFDGQLNDWNYEYTDAGQTDYGTVIFGPEYSTKGSPTYPTNNRVQKGTGGHHIADSNITDTGTLITLGSDTDVNGTLDATNLAIGGNTLDQDIATLSLPASTTISTFGASLIDDTTAAAARTTLDVDQAGTDNSTDVTLAGLSYLSLSGQQITAGTIDISSHTNLAAGTGIDLVGDTVSVDVSDFMTNGSNNRIVTATGTDGMNAEANLTFDGTTLTVTGDANITGANTSMPGHWYSKFYTTTQNYIHLYPQGHTGNASVTDIRAWNGSAADVLRITGNSNNMTWRGHTIWNAGNDGAGSGLDADTVDSLQASQFLRSDTSDTLSGNLSVTGSISSTGNITTYGELISHKGPIGGSSSEGGELVLRAPSNASYTKQWVIDSFTNKLRFVTEDDGTGANGAELGYIDTSGNVQFDGTLTIGGASGTINGNTILTTADEGSGNGLDADTVDSLQASQFLRSDAADTASELITFQKGISQDGNATFYTWRALDNTSSTSNQYFRIARITSTQSSRFAIEIAGRSTSYSDPVIPAIGVIVGQLNNDSNYDIVFYNHKTGTSQVVSEVGQVDVDTVSTDIYIKAGQFAELSATGHISDGSITTYGGDSASATAPTNYVAATEVTVWNSGNDGAGSGLDADTLDGQHASAFLTTESDTLATVTARGASTSTSSTFSGGLVASGGISGLTNTYGIAGSNFDITGVNQITINDPGEGIVWQNGSSGNITLAVVDDASDNILRLSGTGAELQVGTNRVLTVADEGSGNGLDADTVDSLQASQFLRSDTSTVQAYSAGTNEMFKWQNNSSGGTIQLGFQQNDTDGLHHRLYIKASKSSTGTAAGKVEFVVRGSGGSTTSDNLVLEAGQDATWQGNTIWTSGNDGAGSGLDSDTVDGLQASQFVRSDASDTMTGVLTIQTSNDNQLLLQGTDTWAGIGFDDTNSSPDYIWYHGGAQTFAIGGGGANVSGKKLHVDGGMSVGSSADSVAMPSNGLYVEGAVSIGTTSNSAVLDVAGSTAGQTVLEITGTSGQLFSVVDDLTGDIFNVSDATGVPILTVNASGTVTIDDTLNVTGDITAYYSSDERLKDNITEISDANEKILKLRGVEFDWNGNSKNKGHDIGVIAQDVEAVLPELVTTRENTGFKAVKYDKIVALLIQSNKELIKQNQDLVSRIEALESKIK